MAALAEQAEPLAGRARGCRGEQEPQLRASRGDALPLPLRANRLPAALVFDPSVELCGWRF